MSDTILFFGGWAPIGRILVVGTAMYLALVVLLRVSGSRTLASMNAFDFIVTVAMGSAFGGALNAKGVALAEAVCAFVLLVGLQYGVAWLQMRSPFISGVVTNPPTLLYFRGAFLPAAMQRERVTEAAVRAAVRKGNLGSMAEIEAIVLESSGDISVIKAVGDASAFGAEIKQQPHRPKSERDAGDP